ncbi:hypothetical protein WA026_002204 [Henosepilachna vigintioctopunctata]|uniref:Uncharacterized protein n=1 Tax=Henosepilachna vigintioctopunctata TaxID=420089 RepID=A0AAW1TZQ6_9CUCU
MARIRGIVLATCHVTEIVFALCKLIWNWTHHSTFLQCLAQLTSRSTAIKEQYIKMNNKNEGIWLLVVLIFILIEVLTEESLVSNYWILPLLKDAFELEFMIFMLNKIQEPFFVLNSQMMNFLRKIADNNFIDGKDVHTKFSIIGEVSMNHYCFVTLAKDMSSILSLSVLLILTKNFVDVLNSSYYPISSLLNPNAKHNWRMRQIFWVLFSLIKSYVLIYKWNQLIQQVRRAENYSDKYHQYYIHPLWKCIYLVNPAMRSAYLNYGYIKRCQTLFNFKYIC